jgi:hypothetical protein
LRKRLNLDLNLPDLLIPVLQDQQFFQHRLHARTLSAEVNCVNVSESVEFDR